MFNQPLRHILRVIVTMDPTYGGPCQGIRNSIPALAERGISNEIVTLDDPGSAFLGKDNFLIHALGPGISPFKYSRKLLLWLMENFHRFDAVIIHGLWYYHHYGTYRAWVKFIKGKTRFPKLYVMPHGMLDPYFQQAEDRKLKAIRNRMLWHFFDGQSVNGATGLLFTCKKELELAKSSFKPYAPKSELNIGYGVASAPVFRSNMVLEFQKKCPFIVENDYWLFLSRIHPKKGVKILIEAYLKLKEKMFSIPDLVIAGPGMNTSFGQKMLALSRNDDQIHFPGMLQGEAKFGAFYGCEAFVLPSHQENFGVAIVEALACGKPVLITEQVNICDEIKEGRGGLVFPDTFEGIYQLLETWVTMSEEIKFNMAKKALKLYTEKFTVEEAAKVMIDKLNR